MKTARIQNNIVVEILTPIDGYRIEDCFHPEILAACEQVEDEVQPTWVKQEDGSFAAPVEPEPTPE